MKNLIVIFLFCVTSVAFSQHKIKGTLYPKTKSDWIIVYKLEGTKQVFINNTSLKSDSLKIGKKKEAVSTFEITLPSYAKPGAYRATYALERNGSVDFIYNKEDVSFIFNPNYPHQSIAFSKSAENKLYKEYVDKISVAQQALDSIQIEALQNPNATLSSAYQKSYASINSIQKKYLELSKNNYIHPFIKAYLRTNATELFLNPDDYVSYMKKTFLDKIDFSNKVLINSSFIRDRISDYVFYLHYSEDVSVQQNLYKEAIKTVLSKITSQPYQKEIIEFLITQFEESKNLEIIDYLFDVHYNTLPIALQDAKFKSEKQALFLTEVGRIAPDFSWTENGKKMQLSALKDGTYYVMVFWSTSCSHCLREIPQLHAYMKDKKNIKVIGFALEKEASVWETYSKTNLYGWHNVLGLKKWENETARTYQINSTPTYFVLDKNKKIIAKPDEIQDVKDVINSLKM